MIKYRSDIDGLRGIAVLLVVWFHSGLPYISGGFIGVDIFFVISGYLITSIILKDITKNRFTFTQFYERRTRRILPALYVMMTLTLLVFSFIQVPSDFLKSSISAIAAVLFSANIYFWHTTDYFNDTSEFEPFLHMWSLGVEEQFYFLFPVFLLIFLKKKKFLLISLLLIFFVSFALSIYTTYFHQWASYYLLPSRGWQMMAGALIAIYPQKHHESQNYRLLMSVSAFILMALPAVFYDQDTRFPGLAALLPTLGAVMAISLGASGDSFIKSALSIKPLVWLGLISYSLYLWHWPVFAFIRNYLASTHIPLELSILGILVSLLLAYLSWVFVEKPFRDKSLFSRKKIFFIAASYSIFLISISSTVTYYKGFPQRMSPDVITLSNLSGDHIRKDQCMNLSLQQIKKTGPCRLNGLAKDKVPSVILWGDSHAGALKQEFEKLMGELQIDAGFFGSLGCPPIPGLLKTNYDSGKACLDFNESALSYIVSKPEIETVILHSRWAVSVEGSLSPNEGGKSFILKDIYSTNLLNSDKNQRHVFSAFTRLISELDKVGKSIIIITSVPEHHRIIPRLLANKIIWKKNKDLRLPKDIFLLRQKNTDKMMKQIASKIDYFVYPKDIFCDSNFCNIEKNYTSFYFDDDHLSNYGASLIMSELKKGLDSFE